MYGVRHRRRDADLQLAGPARAAWHAGSGPGSRRWASTTASSESSHSWVSSGRCRGAGATNPSMRSCTCSHAHRWRSRYRRGRSTAHVPMPTIVYTDGACSREPRPGGWAWAVPDGAVRQRGRGPHHQPAHGDQAALEALRTPRRARSRSSATRPTSSTASATGGAWAGRPRGWKNSQKKPVANRDLWEPLIELVLERGRRHVPLGEGPQRRRDERPGRPAGRRGRRAPSRAASGDRPPEELGPAADLADRRGAPRGAGADGRRARPATASSSSGHRPPELGGYDAEPGRRAPCARRLARDPRGQGPAPRRPRGAHRPAARGRAARRPRRRSSAGVPFVAVLPYPEPERPWPSESQARFRGWSPQARTVVARAEARRHQADVRRALARRDAWLTRDADEAVVVWDGDDRIAGQGRASHCKRLGETRSGSSTPVSSIP